MIIEKMTLNEKINENFWGLTKKNKSENKYENFPINKECMFKDDVWSFRGYDSLERSKSMYVLKFGGLVDEFKECLKRVVLEKILVEENAISSIKNFLQSGRKFLFFLQERGRESFVGLDVEEIKKFMDSIKNNQEHNKVAYKRYILELLVEAELANIVIDKEIYEVLKEQDLLLIKAEKENGKTNQIPKKIFNKIVALGIEDIKNTTVDVEIKRIACLLIILSETGMRLGELIRIEVGKLRTVKITNEISLKYLEFKSYKTTNSKEFIWTECFAHEKLIMAYEELVNLNKKIRKSKYLYVLQNSGTKPSETTIKNHILKFLVYHQKDFEFENLTKKEKELLKEKQVTKNVKEGVGVVVAGKIEVGDRLYYVSPHQFRVTVCTILYEQGIDLEWIRNHMNHLSDDMTLHYIRVNRILEKNRLMAKALKERMDSRGEYLETDAKKINKEELKEELTSSELKQYYKEINRFLQKNNLKIERDLNKIIDRFSRLKEPLFEMEYGYCAQHALSRICERKAYISSLNDLYYLKPQIPDLSSLDLTYSRYKEKVKIVKYNKKIGKQEKKYYVEYEREKKALDIYIENKLLPELYLLKEAIEKEGKKKIIEKYSYLKKIINKIDYIIKNEVKEWKVEKW